MAYPVGQVLSAPVVNGSPQDLFGTHIDYLGVGGYRSVATILDRDNIPTKSSLEYDGLGSGMRRHLMLVAVQETGLIYILYKPDFQILADDKARLSALKDNNNWLDFGSFLKITTTSSIVTTSSNTFIKELDEYTATQDGVQTISLPANTTGVFNINVIDFELGYCLSVYQSNYRTDLNFRHYHKSSKIMPGLPIT